MLIITPLGTYLRDIFNTAVDKHTETCKHQCMEEFYTAKTISWFMTENLTPQQLQEEGLASKIFILVRDRITKNVLRKVYNLLLFPFFQEDLWDEIQTHIFKMDQQAMEEMMDNNSIEDTLDHELEELETQLENIHEGDLMLHEVTPRLARLL